MLTKPRIEVLKAVKKLTSHKLKFYVQNRQFWFKNFDTQMELPVPIALLEAVVNSAPDSEEYRISLRGLQQHVEGRHESHR